MGANVNLSNNEIMFIRPILTLAFICFTFVIQSQNVIYSYTFDVDMENWQSISLSNSGLWDWAPNGVADLGTYWNARPPIDGSDNGALVYDGDYIINSNQGDTSLDYSTVVESPLLDFSTDAEVYIKFNQYFRNYNSETSLLISSNLGASWDTISLNQGVKRNVETSNKDYEIINISDLVANQANVYIRFLFEGQYYFWLLDDIIFYDDHPVIPTFPANIGAYLTTNGYPYKVDDKGWPYIPRQAIVNFAPGISQAIKDQLREDVGAIVQDSCVCNTLETWSFIDSLLVGPIGLSSNGVTTGADEQISTSTTASEIDEIDFNKYVQGDLTDGPFAQTDIDEILDAHQSYKGEMPLRIAIIDTGIDILHEGLANFLYRSKEIPENDLDDDENCYPDNYVGWNFVDDNNNASDDHGHGTHVAGIVAKSIAPEFKNHKIQIIPYKTHDSKGLASLFDVTCAMYQSIEDNVSVVNCSWGFYGNESQVLKTAITEANQFNITVVAATGNDSLNLLEARQYPACYKLPNLISVGSYNIDNENEIAINSYFSNYSAKFVDVLAPGVNILSTVPYNEYDTKTGTSMAAPAVAGLAATKYLMGYEDPESVKFSILEEAQIHDYLASYVLSGNVLLEDISFNNENDYDLLKKSSEDNFFNRSERSMHMMEILIKRYDQQISLQFLKNYKKATAYVTNTQGQILINHDLENIREGATEMIDLSSLPMGLYFLRINEVVYEFAVY